MTHDLVWCVGPQEPGQIMSIYSEGIAAGYADKYPETIYFFAELTEVGHTKEEEYYDDNTLFKVREALLEAGVLDPTNAISMMQNAGILFRERTY